jgi:hypothetical protein
MAYLQLITVSFCEQHLTMKVIAIIEVCFENEVTNSEPSIEFN